MMESTKKNLQWIERFSVHVSLPHTHWRHSMGWRGWGWNLCAKVGTSSYVLIFLRAICSGTINSSGSRAGVSSTFQQHTPWKKGSTHHTLNMDRFILTFLNLGCNKISFWEVGSYGTNLERCRNWYNYIYICVLPATSPWGVSESWGGGVPTSDSELSVPRICS